MVGQEFSILFLSQIWSHFYWQNFTKEKDKFKIQKSSDFGLFQWLELRKKE
jgi:hypothetical protein